MSYYWIYVSYIEINEVYMASHLVLYYEKSSGMRMHLNIRYRIVYHALAIRLGRAQPQPLALQNDLKKYDPTIDAPGGKRLMPDTPDR